MNKSNEKLLLKSKRQSIKSSQSSNPNPVFIYRAAEYDFSQIYKQNKKKFFLDCPALIFSSFFCSYLRSPSSDTDTKCQLRIIRAYRFIRRIFFAFLFSFLLLNVVEISVHSFPFEHKWKKGKNLVPLYVFQI